MSMNRLDLDSKVRKLFAETLIDQTETATLPELTGDTVLLDSGLDSLGFAVLVTRLEEELGFDPFSIAAGAYYPRTLGEFVDFYAANAPK